MRSRATRVVSWLLVGAFAGLAVLRGPFLLEVPRLWAEEATIYFVGALGLPWHATLVRAARGYFAGSRISERSGRRPFPSSMRRS